MSEGEKGERRLARLEEAVSTWAIGLWEHDHLSDEMFACARTRNLYGFGPDEQLTIAAFVQAIYPADMPSIVEAIGRAHDPSGDGRFDVLHRIVRPSGEIRWIQSRSRTAFDSVDGRRLPTRTHGSNQDMTERHELKLALEVQESRLREATSRANVGIMDWNHDAVEGEPGVYWSPTMRELLGYPANLSPDLGWFMARVHPEDRGLFPSGYELAAGEKRPANLVVEFRWNHPNGTTRWFLARSLSTFRWERGVEQPLRSVGALLDITGSKLADRELAQRSAILDATPDVVCIFDRHERIRYLNAAARRFWGVGFEVNAASLLLVDLVGASVVDLVQRFAVDHPRGGATQHDAVFSPPERGNVPVSIVLLAHRDRDAEVEHFSLIARDLSKEKSLEAQIRQAQKMEAIGKLAGGIAHDLNNILSVIICCADLLGDFDGAESVAHEEVHEIRRAAERAAALTRQLLAFSHKQILQPKVIDLNSVLSEMIPMLRRLIPAGIALEFVPGLGAGLTKADPNQIEQVLLNLVVNARDAMPQGGTVQIEVGNSTAGPEADHLQPSLPVRDYVTLTVSDTGEGIPKEILGSIFEPFFTTKSRERGTGLGLSTVFGIVSQSGGGIRVFSEMGKGTTFKVYLPSTEEHLSPSDVVIAAQFPFRGGTILLAEDDTQVRQMVLTVLRRAGYEVLAATSAVEALGIARAHRGAIDLVLSDVVMPQMQGPELAREVRKIRPDAALLFVSGYTEDSALLGSIQHDEVDFLPKPLSAKSLLDRVSRILGSRAAP